jgi:hypothetical protein
VPGTTKMWFQVYGASQFAMGSPPVDDAVVTNNPQDTSTAATGQVQCFNSASDVRSKVA